MALSLLTLALYKTTWQPVAAECSMRAVIKYFEIAKSGIILHLLLTLQTQLKLRQQALAGGYMYIRVSETVERSTTVWLRGIQRTAGAVSSFATHRPLISIAVLW
jgi:hypothetical protein